MLAGLALGAAAENASVETQAIFSRAAEHGDIGLASDEAARLLTEVSLTRHARDVEAFADAGFAFALTTLLEDAALDELPDWFERMTARPEAARELAFIYNPHHDDAEAVLSVFERLDEAFGPQLDTYPGLTAALCVVHDRKIERRVNENQVTGTDPIALFRYYRDHESQMLFGIRDMPAALLVWVVDSTASIEEMRWALAQYAGDRAIGRRFFDIRYDYDHLRRGTPKQVTLEGFTLPNILKHGGVCADQAYFAVQVGKAIGVPATYTRGRSGSTSHAWVGYFEQRGRRGAGWNFNEGRYASYQGVRGVAEHPQTGHPVDDSFISVLAEAITLPATQRHAAQAMVHGARLMDSVANQSGGAAVMEGLVAASSGQTVRSASLQDRLSLIESALRLDVGYAAGWMEVARLAEGGALSQAQQRKWAASIIRLCGDRYPDFMITVLRPFLSGVEDPEVQSGLWNQALRKVRSRKDLSAEIRMIQGELWEEAGDLRRSADFYEDVIRRYANGGPYVLDALERFEALLRSAGRDERVVVLYAETFKSLDLPQRKAPQFAKQSNYYRVGSRYAEALRDAGDLRGAEQVASQIERQTGVAAAMP
ncbi:MAG: hypothetical protein AAF916_03015 [Planctomycetota bacterium]